MKGSVVGPLTNSPKGVFLEGIISGTPKPGTIMTLKAGVAPQGGRFTYEPYETASGADGDPRMQAVLLEDHLQGKTFSDAYVSGTRCFMYVPISGEEMNILLSGEGTSGSANVFTIGERLKVEHASGHLIAEGTSANQSPWMLLEAVTEAVSTDTLAWCQRT